jgi:predicted dinucleotide-binding enzyme
MVEKSTLSVSNKESRYTMSTISIIGPGNMAHLIGVKAIAGGNAVEITGRDPAKAAALASALGGGATTGTFGAAPAGDIVLLAVNYASCVPIVTHHGDALAGKIIVDMSNNFAPGGMGLITPEGTSAAQDIAKAAPASAHVVKAFNTVFGNALAQGRPLDVLIAGDDAQAKTRVSVFITSLGLRPLDAGPLAMARWLEGTGLVMMGLGRNGVGNFNFSLDVNIGLARA